MPNLSYNFNEDLSSFPNQQKNVFPNNTAANQEPFRVPQKIISDVEKIYMKIIDTTVEKCKVFQNPRIMDALRTRWVQAVNTRLNASRNSKNSQKFLNINAVIKSSITQNSLEYSNILLDSSERKEEISKRLLYDEKENSIAKKQKIVESDICETKAQEEKEKEEEDDEFADAIVDEVDDGDVQNNKDNEKEKNTYPTASSIIKKADNKNNKEDDDEFNDAEVDEDDQNGEEKAKVMKMSEDINQVTNSNDSFSHEMKDINTERSTIVNNEHLEEEDDVGTLLDDIGHVSDLDDPNLSDLEDDEPQTNDFIVAHFEKVARPSSKKQGANANWRIDLRAGIMQLDGQEIIFDKLVGEFVFS